jgi:hypothetical protein
VEVGGDQAETRKDVTDSGHSSTRLPSNPRPSVTCPEPWQFPCPLCNEEGPRSSCLGTRSLPGADGSRKGARKSQGVRQGDNKSVC